MQNERLGKYLLLKKLSEIGPTQTFLAKSSVADGLNKFFILKKTLRTTTAKIEIPSLSHSNILAVFDSGIDRGFFFSVMDYFESYSVAQILNDFGPARCQLGIDQCLYIVRETAAALIYAHNYTIHGKIGTNSILVGLDGAVKVADFDYIADDNSKAVADLHTLGQLLSELLGDNRRANTDLEALCTRALSEDHSIRFQSATELYRELNRYLNTNYPDFSSPEFGEQLTKFYGVAVQEQREKLREYANIDFQKSVPLIVPDIYDLPEKSIVTSVSRVSLDSLPEGFGKIPTKGTSPDVNFENISRVNPFMQSAPPRRPPPRITVPKIQVTEDEKPSFLSDLMLLTAVGLLLTLICYTYNVTIKNYSKKMLETVNLAERHAETKALPDENYSAGVISRMGANRQLSYVNIRVLGATSDTRIFINGKELLEKSPIKMHPIFAGEETVVSAFSAKTNRSDVKKINAKTGEINSVLLSLRLSKN